MGHENALYKISINVLQEFLQNRKVCPSCTKLHQVLVIFCWIYIDSSRHQNAASTRKSLAYINYNNNTFTKLQTRTEILS